MDKENEDLRVRRPATVLMITLNRFQRDTLLSISEKTGANINDLIDKAINKYLEGKWIMRCQTCDYELKITDLKEMYNPNLTCSKCQSVQFWQHIPAEVINYGAKSDKLHF